MDDFACGHPRSPENTYTYFPPSMGGRPKSRCKACHTAGCRRRYVARPRTPGARYAANQRRIAARLEDFDWLNQQGESFDEIAARFGILPVSLQHWLWRNGRTWKGEKK